MFLIQSLAFINLACCSLGPESMVDYCSDTLSNGKFIFTCPDLECDVEWDYFVVRHVASVSATASQLEEFDTLVSENYLQRNSKMLQCPGCMTWCFKDDVSNCVDCPICRQKYGLGSRFCWCCLGRWRGESRGKFCGNVNCDGVDRRIIILAVCPDRLIVGRWCPSIRGCPKCGLLIEYLECCTQMNCRGCKHYFCFFCLKGANTKLELTCYPWVSQCQIAARQTALPGLWHLWVHVKETLRNIFNIILYLTAVIPFLWVRKVLKVLKVLLVMKVLQEGAEGQLKLLMCGTAWN